MEVVVGADAVPVPVPPLGGVVGVVGAVHPPLGAAPVLVVVGVGVTGSIPTPVQGLSGVVDATVTVVATLGVPWPLIANSM